jgi:FKBP-type peptidyl-prolyl cis-trans isomerase FkpA
VINKFHIACGTPTSALPQRRKGERDMKNYRGHFTSMAMAVLLSGCGEPAQQAATPDTAAMSEEQQTLYALGAALANNLRELELTAEDKRLVTEGFEDAVAGVPARVDVAGALPRIQGLRERRMTAAIAARREEGAKFVAHALTQPGAQQTASGLVFQTLAAGTGRQPGERDVVTVHYQGRLPSGQIVESSLQRGKPLEFRVNGVIACWREALLMMRVGGKSHVVCPPDLAYGTGGSPPVIPPGATLAFDIELLGVARPDDARGS